MFSKSCSKVVHKNCSKIVWKLFKSWSKIVQKNCSKVVQKLFKKIFKSSKVVQKLFKSCSKVVQKLIKKIVQKLFKSSSKVVQKLFKKIFKSSKVVQKLSIVDQKFNSYSKVDQKSGQVGSGHDRPGLVRPGLVRASQVRSGHPLFPLFVGHLVVVRGTLGCPYQEPTVPQSWGTGWRRVGGAARTFSEAVSSARTASESIPGPGRSGGGRPVACPVGNSPRGIGSGRPRRPLGHIPRSGSWGGRVYAKTEGKQ